MNNPIFSVSARVRSALQAAVIVLVAGWVFSPAIRGGWVWDDFAEIVRNPVLRDPAGIRKIWFAPAAADYFPLKTTAQWLEWHLWGGNVMGYHLVNLGLHLLSAFLLWHLLRKLGVRGAWLGGLLFAIHPLTVESVAWISEFKNTLSLPLLLLAMIFWMDWDNIRWSGLSLTRSFDSAEKITPTILPNEARSGQHAPPFFALSLLCFLAAMLSKSSVVMFPIVILLYCWWKRGRVARSDLLASVPFFAVSLVLGLVTVVFQEHRAIAGADLSTGGFLSRCAGAGLAVFFYLGKSIVPIGLMPNYPRWDVDPPSLWQFWPWVVVAIATIFICRWSGLSPTRFFAPGGEVAPNANEARSGQHAPPAVARHLVFGLGFFLINLLPVLGFIPMSYLRISWVADHFAYLPLVGAVGLAAAAISKFELKYLSLRSVRISKSEIRFPLFAFRFSLFLLLAALAIDSHRYARAFASDESLWTYALAHNPDSWTAHNDLGMDLAERGRVAEAIGHYEAALRLKPDYAAAHINLGNTLVRSNRLPDALAQYEAALRLEPRNIEALTDEGNALAQSGRYLAAIGPYEEVVRLRPDFPEARYDLAYVHYQLGNDLGNAGRFSDAVVQYTEALRLRPDDAEAHANLGLALANTGRSQEAILQLEKALELKPAYEQAQAYLGFALAGAGRLDDAIAHYQQALRLSPDDADVHYNLGLALRQAGRSAEANAQFAEAERLGSAH